MRVTCGLFTAVNEDAYAKIRRRPKETQVGTAQKGFSMAPLCNAFIINILSQLTMIHKKDSRVKVMHVALERE